MPRTEKASVAPNGTEGNGDSGGPSLSADGAADAFLRDPKTGGLQRIKDTVDTDYDSGRQPALSAGGRLTTAGGASAGSTAPAVRPSASAWCPPPATG